MYLLVDNYLCSEWVLLSYIWWNQTIWAYSNHTFVKTRQCKYSDKTRQCEYIATIRLMKPDYVSI